MLPLAEPLVGADGAPVREIAVPRGTPLIIAIRACNRNRALWGADALEWKPERWLKPLPRAVEDANIPGIYANLWVALFSDTWEFAAQMIMCVCIV